MYKIAICDDEEKNRSSIKKICNEYFEDECKIRTFSKGEELIGDNDNMEFDIIFLDIQMGKINGIQVKDYLVEKNMYINKTVVVLILTVVMAILTSLIQIAAFTSNKDFSSIMRLDIQNINYFKFSPYDLKLYHMWLIIMGLRVLGYVTIASFMIMLTMWFKKIIIPFSAGTIIFCGGFTVFSKTIQRITLITLNGRSSETIENRCSLFRKYTPFGIIRKGMEYFSEYEPNDIFNIPVSNIQIAIIVNILFSVIFIVAGYFTYIYRFRKKGI